jgi:hypothetical protein
MAPAPSSAGAQSSSVAATPIISQSDPASVTSSTAPASSSTQAQSSSSDAISSVASTLSTIVSHTPSSTVPSATTTPSVCPYMKMSGCQPFTGTFASACPASNGMCNSGYVVNCSKFINQGSVLRTISNIGSADACVEACTQETLCIAANHIISSNQCRLWKTVTNAPTSNNINAFFKMCPTS